MKLVNVLLVDDEEPFVAAISKRLTRRGFVVNDAFSGKAALNVLRENPHIEVVILDVKMPGMDGIETLREIKRRFPLVEVVMLAGHATVESAIEGMKLGAFNYLMKPCDIELLVSQVELAAEKKRLYKEKIQESRIGEITTRRA